MQLIPGWWHLTIERIGWLHIGHAKKPASADGERTFAGWSAPEPLLAQGPFVTTRIELTSHTCREDSMR